MGLWGREPYLFGEGLQLDIVTAPPAELARQGDRVREPDALFVARTPQVSAYV